MVPVLAGEIEIGFKHSHATTAADALRLRRVTEEVKEEFYNYFHLGMTACEARHFHQSKLLVEDNCYQLLADASQNPTVRQVQTMHDTWRKINLGPAIDPMNILKEKVKAYEAEGFDIHIGEKCLIIVTPIAKRNQALPSASEIIFVDSTSSCDTMQSTITIMLSATATGAIPICILIHEGQSLQSYKNAFGLLKKHFPSCFGGKSEPQAFMTDDSAAEKGALRELWPSARQLLCQFHVAQAEWRWLCSSRSGISTSDRQHHMKLFQKVMYAKGLEELEIAVQNILNREQTPFTERFKAFYEQRKEEWVSLFRKNLVTRNNNTNNYSEVTIRILKDIVLSRTKAFNIVALVDFCVTTWEKYFQKRILDHAFSRNAKDIINFRMLCSRMDISPQDIHQESEHTYSVPSEKRRERYIVNTLIGICTCAFGLQGAFCKHMATLVQKCNVSMPNSPAINYTERFKLGQLALGSKCPNISFFYDYKSQTSGCADENFQSQPSSSSIETSQNIDMMEDPEDEQQEMEVDDEVNELLTEIDSEWLRIKSLVTISNKMSLQKALFCLRKVKNNSLLDDLCFNMPSRIARKGGKIKVQPTAISRRKSMITKGSRRISAGRPPKNGPARRHKRPRNLSQNIDNNILNAISHGHGH